jgi:ribose 5-phosphate isomerase B
MTDADPAPVAHVAIACDHAALELKESLKRALTLLGFDFVDLGTNSPASTDYPDYAHAVANGVAAGRFRFGVLVCGTGLGMSMAANRHPGVRAAVCSESYSARMAREHNDANVLCLGARVLGVGLAEDILKTFLEATFEGGRHAGRVAKIECSIGQQ